MGWVAIENGIVIPMTPDRQTIDGGHVLIEHDRIVAVGPGPAPNRPGLQRLDAAGGVVLPGFVDTHAHAGHALTKSLGASASDWMGNAGRVYAGATDLDFWRAEARLSALERLMCGVTTACLLMGGGPDVMMTASPDAANAHLDGIASVGVAEVLAVGPNRPDGPRLYGDWTGGALRERRTDPGRQLEVTNALLRSVPGGGLRQLAVSLPVFTAVDLSPEGEDGAAALSRAAQRVAREHGVLLVQDGHRDGSLAATDARVGLGGPDALFAHCIDLTPDDIAALQRSGAAVAHNPSALMSVFGRCPAPELMAAGVRVGLGSDAPAPDRSFDMFRHMFQAHRYHARHFADDSVLPPWTLLEMATIGGARALRLEREIGSLEPGKRADLMVVDWRKPHLWPPAAPVERLARFATGADVDTVLVAGRVLMRGRRVLSVDPDVVLDDAARAYAAMLPRAGLGQPYEALAAATPHGGARL
ncbi:hydrolase [Alsobacter metallidurans]|uniref:Hydrolase n=1 Tax=Alsobacter metallidurans TaxID=340221 RepID=A0A917I457_9HYPH|nr:amidohydrolase family protein [Alsobacter metallidurans]GGH10877.1 hydrolase [Alsobacter metallidurans]